MRKVSISQDLLRSLYVDERLTTNQIAEKLGFCQGTIWKRLHEYKIKPRLSYVPAGLTKEQLKKWYVSQKLSIKKFTFWIFKCVNYEKILYYN